MGFIRPVAGRHIEILCATAHLLARMEQVMLDIALLITGVVFFAICEIYARICERL
jgi:hypothetical protein